jgi:hypothetical protein
MRMPMIASQFGTLAEQAIREKKNHIGYLEALLLAEVEERERNTIERRIREAHLPRMKTLEEFDYTQSPNVTAAKMRDLAEGGYIRKGSQCEVWNLLIQIRVGRLPTPCEKHNLSAHAWPGSYPSADRGTIFYLHQWVKCV